MHDGDGGGAEGVRRGEEGGAAAALLEDDVEVHDLVAKEGLERGGDDGVTGFADDGEFVAALDEVAFTQDEGVAAVGDASDGGVGAGSLRGAGGISGEQVVGVHVGAGLFGDRFNTLRVGS